MEKESVKDVFLRYGVLLGKRNTERQKTDFLRAAQKQLEQAGFPVDITCVSASLMRRESVNMYNLYAGDFKKADVVFITYYDTPLWQFYPKEQKAFDANWSRGNFLLLHHAAKPDTLELPRVFSYERNDDREIGCFNRYGERIYVVS